MLEKAFQTLPAGHRVLEAPARSRVLLQAGVGYYGAGAQEQGVRCLVDGLSYRPEALDEPGTYARFLLALVPIGYRTDQEMFRRAEDLCGQAAAMLNQVFGQPGLPAAVRRRIRLARASLHAVFARLLWRGNRRRQASGHAWRSIVLHPAPVLRGAISVLYSRRRAPVAQRIERLASNQ